MKVNPKYFEFISEKKRFTCAKICTNIVFLLLPENV